MVQQKAHLQSFELPRSLFFLPVPARGVHPVVARKPDCFELFEQRCQSHVPALPPPSGTSHHYPATLKFPFSGPPTPPRKPLLICLIIQYWSTLCFKIHPSGTAKGFACNAQTCTTPDYFWQSLECPAIAREQLTESVPCRRRSSGPAQSFHC